MLAELLPLMNATVLHYELGKRTIHGAPGDVHSFTRRAARVLHTQGTLPGAASKEDAANFIATVWLVNHPRPVAIAHMIEIDGTAMRVIGVEHRELQGGTITKAYLQ